MLSAYYAQAQRHSVPSLFARGCREYLRPGTRNKQQHLARKTVACNLAGHCRSLQKVESDWMRTDEVPQPMRYVTRAGTWQKFNYPKGPKANVRDMCTLSVGRAGSTRSFKFLRLGFDF